MERLSKRVDSTRLSSVVRQFSPSRVEHQLLAQVFEFVVSARCSGRPAAFGCVDARESNKEQQRMYVKLLHGTARNAA
jgi:hypothetical protein